MHDAFHLDCIPSNAIHIKGYADVTAGTLEQFRMLHYLLSTYHQVIKLSEGMLLKLILFYLFISYLN